MNKLCFALMFSSNKYYFEIFCMGEFFGRLGGGGVGHKFFNFIIQLEKNSSIFFSGGIFFWGGVPYPIFWYKSSS